MIAVACCDGGRRRSERPDLDLAIFDERAVAGAGHGKYTLDVCESLCRCTLRCCDVRGRVDTATLSPDCHTFDMAPPRLLCVDIRANHSCMIARINRGGVLVNDSASPISSA